MSSSAAKLNQKFISCAHKGEWTEAFQLLARGANVNSQDNKFGYTALHYAVREDNIESVRQLAASSADLDIQELQGRPPMAFCRSIQILELLVELGSNPSIGFEHGATPFQWFYATGKHELAAAYIDLGLPVMSQFAFSKLSRFLRDGCYDWFRLLTGIEISADDLEIIRARPRNPLDKAERKQKYVADQLVKAIYAKPLVWCHGNKTYEEIIRQP